GCPPGTGGSVEIGRTFQRLRLKTAPNPTGVGGAEAQIGKRSPIHPVMQSATASRAPSGWREECSPASQGTGLSGAATGGAMAAASLGNTPVSASAFMTREGTVTRARCGAAWHRDVSRLHMDSQVRSVHVEAMPHTL